MYGILLYDGVEPIDVGATFGVLSMAKRIVPDLAFTGIARQPGEVVCASGMRVIAEYGIDAPPDALSELIVTGGPGWVDVVNDTATLAFLRTTTARLSAICTGAMILEAAGILDGKRATTKRQIFPGETSPLDILASRSQTETAAIIDDQGVVTSGGVTLGIDAMFYCLARSHGQAVADEVARVMEYSRALEANKSALGYA
jgi:transcriptional regulator GlxA family with amidase domain